METYWIDKQGGQHYHKETCPMVQDTRFSYESIRRRKRLEDEVWRFKRIREQGKYYRPCPGCIG